MHRTHYVLKYPTFFPKQGSKHDIVWAFSLWCFQRTPCCPLCLTNHRVKAKNRWGEFRCRMHTSTRNESCDKVLKSIAFCLTKWLEELSVSSCQKPFHCLSWTQCEKQREQQNDTQVTRGSLEQGLSGQHSALGAPAQTHVGNGRWTGSKGFGMGSRKGPIG